MANERLSYRAFLKDAVFYNEDGNEYNKSFYLYDVALYKDLDCGIGRDDLENQLREQAFSEKEIRRIEEDEFDNWEWEWFYFSPSVVEQCAGLKAKDGRLIYEGDIVEFYSMSLLDALSDRHLERRVGRVVWNSETLKIDVMVGEREVPDLCKKTDDGQFVVIGNINENAELLK